MSYTKNFTPTYQNGWQSGSSGETPITASSLNNYDDAIEYIETYLHDHDFLPDVSMLVTQTLSTSGETTYTFSSANITANSTIDVYTSPINLNYSAMNITAGQCTVTYPKQDTAVSMTCKIYIR